MRERKTEKERVRRDEKEYNCGRWAILGMSE